MIFNMDRVEPGHHEETSGLMPRHCRARPRQSTRLLRPEFHDQVVMDSGSTSAQGRGRPE